MLDVLELGRPRAPERCVESFFPASFVEMEGLRILNLHVTNFNILPAGLWELTKLENLSIFCECYPRNQVVSEGGLGQLCGIQTLRVTRCPFVSWINLLTALRNMNKLAELYMTSLPIGAIIMLSEPSFPCLTELEISWCAKLEKIHIGELVLPNLHTLGIFGCVSLHEIHGFHHLRGLVELQVVDCLVEELFSEGENFPKLKVLELHGMHKLNIDSVMFPSLSEFSLSDCPNLKKLPRGLMNENRSLKICWIVGTRKWILPLSASIGQARRWMDLRHMRKLNIICGDLVMFPFLSEFNLSDFPNLKKVPRGLMNENRSLNSCEIRGARRWLDGQSWQDDEFKSFIEARVWLGRLPRGPL